MELKVHKSKLNRLHPLAREIALIYPLVLAGGAVRDACFGNKIEDYDFFLLDICSEHHMEMLEHKMKVNGFEKIFECPEGKLVTYLKKFSGFDTVGDFEIKFQFIRARKLANVTEALESFDFNATRFALGKYADTVITDRAAIRDVVTKNLSINAITYPAASINRLHKYRNKGYYVGDAIKRIVQIISEAGYMPLGDELYLD
jgi:tRNA nucleotidyltransferase/poly(A) polymerase